jgi:hypothetical protein
MENYLIVLFENKVKKKILKKYITFKKAKLFFDSLIQKNSEVIFEKKIVNGKDSNFEVGLVEKSSSQLLPVYMTDEMGRNIKVKLENDDMTLIQVVEFKQEETIYDNQTSKKIDSHFLIKKYLSKDNVKLVSSLNNKVIIQRDDDISIFSLKNEQESYRLLDSLSLYFFKIKRSDCIFVKDVSSAQKKYLYSLLESKGFNKKILYRKFTTYPQN